MKKLKYSSLLLALCPLGNLSASVTVVTFSELSFEDPLTTLPGWTGSEANPAGATYAWAEPVAGNMAGAIGGAYAEAVNPSASVTMASSVFSSVASVELDVLLVNSSPSFPGRDTFSITVADGSGADLVTVVFEPTVTVADIARWEVGYSIEGGATTYTGLVLNENAWYDIALEFAGSGFTFTFGNTVDSVSLPGAIAGFDGLTDGIGNLSFTWTKAPSTPYGDNYMLFDNITVTVVPEPSTASLLSGLASLMLLRRRQKR